MNESPAPVVSATVTGSASVSASRSACRLPRRPRRVSQAAACSPCENRSSAASSRFCSRCRIQLHHPTVYEVHTAEIHELLSTAFRLFLSAVKGRRTSGSNERNAPAFRQPDGLAMPA